MPTIESIKESVLSIVKDYDLKKVILFGSFASGVTNSDSDIDLLVEFPPKASLFDVAGVQYEMERLTGKKVDVIPSPLSKDSLIKINHEVVLYVQ